MKSYHYAVLLILFLSIMTNSLALAADKSAVTVENSYARAVPPTARNSGAFMLIRNDSDQTRKVVSAKSNISQVTELHKHINDNGVMRMRRVDAIKIPPHGTVELKPGGYHVMLINLNHPLKPGDPVHIDLTLDDGSVLPIDLEARRIGMGMGMMKGKCGSGMRGKCGSGMTGKYGTAK